MDGVPIIIIMLFGTSLTGPNEIQTKDPSTGSMTGNTEFKCYK